MNNEITRIYQAINAVSKRCEEINGKLDKVFNTKISNITPTVFSKTAYYGDTEVVFYNVPKGNITVFFKNDIGFPQYSYTVSRDGEIVTITFDAVTSNTEVTISVL